MRPADRGEAGRLLVVAVLTLLVALLALWGCATDSMSVISTAQQQCVTAKRLQCGPVRYIEPSPKYPCGECGPLLTPTATPTVSPTAAPTSQPTLAPVSSWVPLTTTSFNAADGRSTFTLRGLDTRRIPTREWFLFNVKGSVASGHRVGNRVTGPGWWQQCHIMAWDKSPFVRLTCQLFDAQGRVVADSGPDHNVTFDPATAYTFRATWSQSHVGYEIFVGDQRIVVQRHGLQAPFASADAVTLADGMFGYPAMGGVEIRQ